MEEALTGSPLTQEQQQRPYEVDESLEVPRIQDLIRGWEDEEVVIDTFLTSDSGVAAMSPMGSSGIDTTPIAANIFDSAGNRYGFDYPVSDEDNGDRVDVDVSYNNVDTNIENDDEEKSERVPPVAQTPNRDGESYPHPVRLRRSRRVPFQRLENVPESVIRSLFE